MIDTLKSMKTVKEKNPEKNVLIFVVQPIDAQLICNDKA